MHKSKDYLLESSKSKLDSYRLMYFISHGRLMKLENIRDLSQNDQNNYIGIYRKIISKNFNGRKLGYPLKPDEDVHYIISLSGNMSRIEEILLLNAS